MALGPGTRLGPYEILSAIGAGGMGEVYRATDTSLGRQVAIKVLPAAFAQDTERLARFEREAKTLAALNRPHIAQIYGLEKSSGIQALVMELVEGDDLSQRIARGALPLDEALAIARQIADALDAAHEKGIVHRDLKPANVKITPEGVVKVLDFGLAKLSVADGSRPDLTQSPTVTVGGTREGVILGTAPYMSPEQARGNPVDKRTDIWAFGCVVYEMLTGRIAFAGETVSDTIAAILEREPDWTALPHSVPAAVRRLMQRCLEKDPRRRLRDIADARIEIELDEALTSPATAPTTVARWVSALIVTAAVTGVVVWNLKPGPSSAASIPGSTARFSIAPPPGDPLAVDVTAIAISPDGRQMAYVAGQGSRQRIFLRGIEEFNSTAIPGTEGGDNPFFSPDNMYRKPLDGSGPEERLLVSDRPNYPFSWSDGVLAFVSAAPLTAQDILLLRPDRQGKPAPFLETPFGEGAPAFSPDGRWLAYVSNESGRNEIHVRPFPGPGEKVTISAEGGNEPVWSRNGRELFYRRGDAMMAVEITTSPVLKVGIPRRLFEKSYQLSSVLWPEYDVTPDGQRFMMVKRIDQDDAPAQINIVLNWFEELKRLVPTK